MKWPIIHAPGKRSFSRRAVDLMHRLVLTGVRSARVRKVTEPARDTGLKPDESEQAVMLERIEPEQAPARILATDEEQFILDSTR